MTIEDHIKKGSEYAREFVRASEESVLTDFASDDLPADYYEMDYFHWGLMHLESALGSFVSEYARSCLVREGTDLEEMDRRLGVIISEATDKMFTMIEEEY